MNSIFNNIIAWYSTNKRSLPWRDTNNPYKIWLSEIILQQTKVDQGLPYYYHFIETFPTVFDLANAKEEDVLKLWQGLGYYSRARNLHYSAKVIANTYHGNFPSSYKEILSLKGIGEYTAAAIASFAYNQPHAVVDGNVYRVLSRIFDIETPIDSSEGKRIFQKLADDVLIKDKPALHNQAIMEFGAMQCTPTQPNCNECIVHSFCFAYKNNTIAQRPVKAKKTKVTVRYFYYFIFLRDNTLFIKKRESNDIWKGLYDFPLYESATPIETNELLAQFTLSPSNLIHSYSTKHILSHQRINATFFVLNNYPKQNIVNEDCILITLENLHLYPIPRIIDRYLKEQFHLLT